MLRDDFALRHVDLVLGDGVRVLEDASLELAPGEHVVIVGASGSGKTSLLRLLSGELAPTRGQLRRAGRVASIYQDFRLVGASTALANALHGAAADVGFWRSLSGYPAATRAEAVRWLERVGLGARLHTRVDRLSGGEQQRVALARALMRRPALLLADEPVSALDPDSARALLSLLDELRRQHGITVVSVLHDLTLARAHADRVLTLRQGRLLPLADAAPAPGEATPIDAVTATAAAPVAAAPPPLPAAQPEPSFGFEPRFAAARAAEGRGSPWRWLAGAAGTAAVALLCAWAVSTLDLHWPGEGAGARVARFVGDLVPDAGQWRRIDWAALGVALRDTLLMAWLATLAAVALSLPLAAAAARNVAPAWLRVPTRALLNAIRAVPSLLWALLAVGAFGLGALPGIVALGIYSLGYLTKFYYESLEGTPREVPEALRSLGLGGAQTFFAAILPASRLALLSASVFMLEYNFRTATVLGVVGAGGIGYELKLAIDWGNWHVVGVILAVLIVAVTLFDALASRLRRALA
jgi:phosphonate ABC transporter permease subunit PhnE